MPDDNDKLLENEPQDDDAEDVDLEEADSHETEGDDEGARSRAAASSSGAGSRLIWIIVIIAVVVAVAWLGHIFLERQKEQKAQELRAHMEEAGLTLSNVQGSVRNTLERIGEADEPDIRSAIMDLNLAAEKLGQQANSTQALESEDALRLAQQMVDLKMEVARAADGLRDDQAAYEEAVRAARGELRSAAVERLEPISNKLSMVTSAAYGDAETPTMVPSSRTADTEADEAATIDADEALEPDTEGEEGDTAAAPADEPSTTETEEAAEEESEEAPEADEADAGSATEE